MSLAPVFKNAESRRILMAAYEEHLARWPVPAETREVPTRHGSTSVISSGNRSGPSLVLLHGAASNALMWIADVAELGLSHRVHAVDIIGEPGRSAPTRLPYAGSGYADWLADVLDGLGLRTTRLAGISQGAWLALSFATRHPERVERLVLLSPASVVRDRLTFLLRVLPLLLLGRRGHRVINRIVAAPEKLHPDAMAYMDLILAHTSPRLDSSPLFADDELRRLTMPVLLLGGEQDAIRDCRAIAARLQGLASRVETCLLPNAGHVLVGAAPRMLAFLN
ncbi:MAG: alpha/beta hydrolase [Deltaproteobacteria bacterium]|nr:alpha/beta hydrolase [Deltaproteobacteria bacterium]